MNRRLTAYLISLFVISLIFHRVAWGLIRLSLSSHLYSHVAVMPIVSAYLVFLRRRELPANDRPSIPIAGVMIGAGLLLGLIAWRLHSSLGCQDTLALGALGLVMGVAGGVPLFFGTAVLRAVAVPAALLLFTVPFPASVETWLAVGLQNASAEAAHLMFLLTGTPVFRNGLDFHLPGLSVEVAEACSGIHSTLVLVISSIVAADVLLRTTLKKWLLVGLVIPIGILRNGFRIVSISLLTIRVDPEIIRGPLHRQGGPIYFLLSLVVLLAILLILRRTEPHAVGTSSAGGTE